MKLVHEVFILDIVLFTCGEWKLYQNNVEFSNIMNRIVAAAILTHTGKCQHILRKIIITSSKKIAQFTFPWHQDTLFQPNDILVGTSLSCGK